ncbi:flagellin [Paraclostridium bifermentans]|uniref:flagellin N-terminal helical domain-containing protein n=1 Tax=Paraclostridium bifermentans TaxID=1490 RepID=UPI001C7FDB8D|nr:flagellin [Paraclostridium bifermentans]GIM32910.1 flagellar hook-associated protein 3 [Paraclostridium bifermentans subsp. muricolitidis]
MRITNGSVMSTYLRDLQNNLQSMDKLNTQLNTSKQVNKISDDPFKTVKIMNVQGEINNVEKYNYNCDEITGWLDITDESLDRVGNLTSEIKTLLTSIQDTFGPDEIKAVQTEINEKIKQVGEAMNTTYAGKYVFGGSVTDQPPVRVETDPTSGLAKIIINNTDKNGNIDPDLSARLDASLKSEISDGITMDYNLTIKNITSTTGKETGKKSGLDILNDVVQKLNSDPVDMDEIKKLSSDLGDYMNDVLNNRSLIGAKTNTVSAVKDSNEENILEMKGTFSQMQDVDYADKFMELKEAQMVYNATLQVGAKLLQPTLLDYLR